MIKVIQDADIEEVASLLEQMNVSTDHHNGGLSINVGSISGRRGQWAVITTALGDNIILRW